MQSEFGASDVAEPHTSPIHIPAPDEVPSSMSSQETSQNASRKKEPLFLTDEQQADMIDWLKDNAIIYNKRLWEYRNTEKKNKLWCDKAKELGVDPLNLQIWVDSMRSRYGRLTQTKSGQRAKEKFSFLKDHIARQTSRHGVILSTCFFSYSYKIYICCIYVSTYVCMYVCGNH